MPKLIILGTANAVPDERHENTHMAVVGEERVVLVDCVNNPITRLSMAGIELKSLTDVILTHFHPDHVSGMPMLLMDSWLLGRQETLNVYGLDYTLDSLKGVMDFYDWSTWPNFFPVGFTALEPKELALVFRSDELVIYASPVQHRFLPTIGLRFEFPRLGKVVAYSCDTEPCPAVVGLARQADVLIHEATGATTGHSSAEQAGEIATQAGAQALYLIHYQTRNADPTELVGRAQTTFDGPVVLTEDFMEIEL